MFNFWENRDYYKKQITKGAALFTVGVLGYLGFKTFFGEQNEPEKNNLATEIKNNPAVFDGSFETTRRSLPGVPDRPLHQCRRQFPCWYATSLRWRLSANW